MSLWQMTSTSLAKLSLCIVLLTLSNFPFCYSLATKNIIQCTYSLDSKWLFNALFLYKMYLFGHLIEHI